VFSQVFNQQAVEKLNKTSPLLSTFPEKKQHGWMDGWMDGWMAGWLFATQGELTR